MSPVTFAVFLFLFFLSGTSSWAGPAKPAFFIAGDGHVKIRGVSGRMADVTYATADGGLNDAAFAAIDAAFGFPTATMGENVSRRTVAFLDYFIDAFNKNATAQLASGYRSQNYNNALRKRGATAAKTSTHIDGMALDFSLPGVAGKSLWEMIREKNCCGAGWYHGNVVHLDSARPRFWTTETSKVNTGDSDFNRFIYASTEYDRYEPVSEVRILFTSVSDFGFGVKKTVSLVRDEAGLDAVKEATLSFQNAIPATTDAADPECLLITERKQGRFLSLTLPEKLKAGTYRVRVDFCHKTAPLMPDFRVTNLIEVVK